MNCAECGVTEDLIEGLCVSCWVDSQEDEWEELDDTCSECGRTFLVYEILLGKYTIYLCSDCCDELEGEMKNECHLPMSEAARI